MKVGQKQVERDYAKLLNDVATMDYYKVDLSNRVNCYECKCGAVTKTKDIDAGVTPAMISCPVCKSPDHFARSTFYKDILPSEQPTVEWFRPTLKELLKKRSDPGLVDHVLKGGLLSRPVKKINSQKTGSRNDSGQIIMEQKFTYADLAKAISLMTEDEKQNQVLIAIDDESTFRKLAGQSVIEEDVYVNIDDSDDSGPLNELQELWGDSFDQNDYKLSTPKGFKFLYVDY